jgi:F0F1-type ATP synthase epsilon subunit
MSDQKLLKVKIRDTESVIFEGLAERVSSFNEVGRFDVLPKHANFISIIRQEISLFHQREKIKELKIEQAVMKVKADQIHIFLGIEAFALDSEDSLVKK